VRPSATDVGQLGQLELPLVSVCSV